MKKIRNAIILLLLFNGVNALVGGWMLINDPTGNTIQLPTNWLGHTPFHDFFIPGLILFGANGILSFVVALFVVMKWHYHAAAVVIQGCILAGWIIVQVVMMQTINILHLLMGGVGFALVVLGVVLTEKAGPAARPIS